MRRNPAPGQRRLVGRIGRIASEEVLLSESFDNLARVPVRDVTLEGSRDAFATCLRAILGGRYNKFETERQRLEGELLGGPGIDKAGKRAALESLTAPRAHDHMKRRGLSELTGAAVFKTGQ